MLKRLQIFSSVALLFFIHSLGAPRRDMGILGKPAPGWAVQEWINLPRGNKTLDIKDYQGKVLYLYCFQSWCPGCHRYGFPTLKKVIKKFGKDPKVAITAIQTTFEGFATNTFARAQEVASQYALTIPIGQSGSKGSGSSPLMRQYRNGGTPWVIIIDRKGIVRYNDFHIEPKLAYQLIESLKG